MLEARPRTTNETTPIHFRSIAASANVAADLSIITRRLRLWLLILGATTWVPDLQLPNASSAALASSENASQIDTPEEFEP